MKERKLTKFKDITSMLTDINESDSVFSYKNGEHYIKVRVLEHDVPDDAGVEQQNNTLILGISGSLCDGNGKALADEALPAGYKIALEERHNIHLGMIDDLDELVKSLIKECLLQTVKFDLKLKTRKRFVKAKKVGSD